MGGLEGWGSGNVCFCYCHAPPMVQPKIFSSSVCRSVFLPSSDFLNKSRDRVCHRCLSSLLPPAVSSGCQGCLHFFCRAHGFYSAFPFLVDFYRVSPQRCQGCLHFFLPRTWFLFSIPFSRRFLSSFAPTHALAMFLFLFLFRSVIFASQMLKVGKELYAMYKTGKMDVGKLGNIAKLAMS